MRADVVGRELGQFLAVVGGEPQGGDDVAEDRHQVDVDDVVVEARPPNLLAGEPAGLDAEVRRLDARLRQVGDHHVGHEHRRQHVADRRRTARRGSS